MLTRENTKQLKGFAVLLMLAHHLFAFSDRIPYGFDFSRNIFLSNTLTSFIGVFGKICVPISCFWVDMDYMRLVFIKKIMKIK